MPRDLDRLLSLQIGFCSGKSELTHIRHLIGTTYRDAPRDLERKGIYLNDYACLHYLKKELPRYDSITMYLEKRDDDD